MPSATDMPSVPASAVRRALRHRAEVGLLDVRPEGHFAAGHPLFAASFPLGRLEAEVFDRLPGRRAPLVVYGDADHDAATAAGRLRGLGYRDVSLLDGGLAGWTADGGELFTDVNTPSKAFGELVAATAGTPDLAAPDLQAMLRDRADVVVVVDARRFEEYQTMSIPTATSVPGAELVLRVGSLAPDPATTVVVNCAGRTRSIIGAQSLINAGRAGRVLALRNGTIGWTLAGLTLDHGQARRAPEVPGASARHAQTAAWAVARKAGVRRIGAAGLRSLAGGQRTVYRFDVRTPEEYAAGHPAGFRPAPGGQLVQETDWFAPVRGALVVLADDGAGRAAMTGSWLAQMGWQVVLWLPGPASPAEAGPWQPALPPPPEVARVSPAQVEDWLSAGEALVVDVDTSRQFLAGHLPGAAWALRTDLAAEPAFSTQRASALPSQPASALPSHLASALPSQPASILVGQPPSKQLSPPARLVLTSADGFLAAFAAADLPPPLRSAVTVLDGGTTAWAASGRPLQTGPGQLLSAPVDVYRRPYEGTGVDPAVMQAYLDWEHGLVAQLGRDGTHNFTVLTGPSDRRLE